MFLSGLFSVFLSCVCCLAIREEKIESRAEVKEFDKNKLNHVETVEKNQLPNAGGTLINYKHLFTLDWHKGQASTVATARAAMAKPQPFQQFNSYFNLTLYLHHVPNCISMVISLSFFLLELVASRMPKVRPDRSDVMKFDKDQLKHVETSEKVVLPDQKGWFP